MKVVLLSNHYDFTRKESPKEDDIYNQKLSLLLKNKGIQLIRTSSFEFDFNTNTFSKGEFLDGTNRFLETNITPDKILCYSNQINYTVTFISKLFLFTNSIDFISLANDKYATAKLFSQFSPKTYLASEIDVSTLRQKDYILKPIGGTGGHDIERVSLEGISSLFLEKKEDLSKYILQEFLDLSLGIDGIVEGIHDVRVICFGEQIFPYAYIRTPRQGDFRCNICQGGSGNYIEMEKIPQEFLEAFHKMHQFIKEKLGPGFYSVDLVNTSEGVKLIELNSSPAFFLECEVKKDGNDLFMEYLVRYINTFN